LLQIIFIAELCSVCAARGGDLLFYDQSSIMRAIFLSFCTNLRSFMFETCQQYFIGAVSVLLVHFSCMHGAHHKHTGGLYITSLSEGAKCFFLCSAL